MNRMTRICACVLLVAPALCPAATLYKWVDADGHTHYTQEPPPPGSKGETIKPPRPVDSAAAQKETEELEKSLNATEDARAKGEKTAKEDADYAAQKKQKCEQAKQRLEKAQMPLTSFVDKDGTRRRASEEERQQQIKESEKQVKEFCG